MMENQATGAMQTPEDNTTLIASKNDDDFDSNHFHQLADNTNSHLISTLISTLSQVIKQTDVYSRQKQRSKITDDILQPIKEWLRLDTHKTVNKVGEKNKSSKDKIGKNLEIRNPPSNSETNLNNQLLSNQIVELKENIMILKIDLDRKMQEIASCHKLCEDYDKQTKSLTELIQEHISHVINQLDLDFKPSRNAQDIRHDLLELTRKILILKVESIKKDNKIKRLQQNLENLTNANQVKESTLNRTQTPQLPTLTLSGSQPDVNSDEVKSPTSGSPRKTSPSPASTNSAKFFSEDDISREDDRSSSDSANLKEIQIPGYLAEVTLGTTEDGIPVTPSRLYLRFNGQTLRKKRLWERAFEKVRAGSSLVTDDILLQLPFAHPGNKKISAINKADYPIPRSMSWHQRQQCRKVNKKPFSYWDNDTMVAWICEQSLGKYVRNCKRYLTKGSVLLKCSIMELENELGIKHPIHQRKLQLAIQAEMSDASDLAGRLDNNWVMRWLDDIGLPQYKEVMNTAKVDGRILNYLTLDDLSAMKITDQFHQISIKRSIQCLRKCNFHPNYMKRRPLKTDRKEDEDVMVWTNGHIIEWLRSNDIAEYASNLRSSGVHGALFSLEPLFNSDTLIELLNIPIGEVRLHRQTATLFNALIGPECQLTKKQAEAETGTELLLSLARQQKALKMPSSVVSFKNGKLVHGDVLCPIGENDDPMPPRKPPRVFLSNNRTLRDRSFSNDVIARTESLSIHNSGR